MRPKKDITLADIAQKTGVSIVTVSNALAGRDGVSPEVRRKIEECARQLGYQRSPAGTQGKEETVSVSVLFGTEKSGAGSESMELFLQHLKAAAETKHVQLSIGTVQDISKKQVPEIQWRKETENLIRNDGMILCGSFSGQELKAVLNFFKVPAVGWGFMNTAVDIDYLMDDGFRGIGHAVRHLKECGASDFLYVAGNELAEQDLTDRLLGFYNAMYENGLMKAETVSAPHAWKEHNLDSLQARLNSGDPPDAVVCASDETAAEVKTVLSEAGLQVPRDLLLTGYRGGASTDPEGNGFSSCVIPLDIHAQLCLDLVKKRIQRGGKPKGVRMVECCFVRGETTGDIAGIR